MVMARNPGAPRSLCKKTLEEHDDDVDAAAKHINDTTEFKDTSPPEPARSDGVGGGNLTTADLLATSTVAAASASIANGGSGEGSASGVASLASLGGTVLPGMSAALDAIEPAKAAAHRPKFVPVSSKAEAVSCLRNIATSNDANRAAITGQKVIPQLVKLMTLSLIHI